MYYALNIWTQPWNDLSIECHTIGLTADEQVAKDWKALDPKRHCIGLGQLHVYDNAEELYNRLREADARKEQRLEDL